MALKTFLQGWVVFRTLIGIDWDSCKLKLILILKWNLNKGYRSELDSSGSGHDPVVGSSEYGAQYSGSINSGNYRLVEQH
jgi:hypothetical protein